MQDDPPSSTTPDTRAPSTLNLPELQQAVVDHETLDRLFQDIAACTKVLEVIPKFNDRAYVPESSLDLNSGRDLFLNHRLRALQLRYLYQGTEWWDTLMHLPGQVKLVRIQHDFDNS